MKDNSITFQFISEPQDVNFGGKVHGGAVMKWIDQAAFTCARTWAETYCVTVYVGGIRFMRPINIGDVVKIEASIIHTGNSSMHIAVEVFSKSMEQDTFQKTTHCIAVFVSVDKEGNPQTVKVFTPVTEEQKKLSKYAQRLNDLREDISEEMKPYL